MIHYFTEQVSVIPRDHAEWDRYEYIPSFPAVHLFPFAVSTMTGSVMRFYL
jgi:hypothetical protein